MCIAEAVGKSGANRRDDVKIVQILLNMSGAQPLLAVDGAYGGNTGAAIERFQASIGQQQPTGRVTAGDETIQRLKERVPSNWGQGTLQAIMPGAPDARIDKFLGPLKSGMQASGITTPLQQAHFLAQIAHESGELLYTAEIASGSAYEGRQDLGNTEPGDGPRFKGRGLIQLTGRANYGSFKKDSGIDVVTNPERVAEDVDLAVAVSCWFWMKHKLNDLATGDDVRPITKVINGGYNGLESRQTSFRRAKFFLV